MNEETKRAMKEYFSGCGKRGWEARKSKCTPEEIKEQQSKAGKVGAKARAEMKRNKEVNNISNY